MTVIKQIVEKNKLGIEVQFFAEVEFGNPQTKDCRNFGICRVYPIGWDSKITPCRCKMAQAIITVLDNAKVELDFLKSSMTPITYQQFFGEKYFLILADFQYDFFREKEYQIYLPMGRYAIIENDSLIKVVIE